MAGCPAYFFSSWHPLRRQSTVTNSKRDKLIIQIQHGKLFKDANGTSRRINFFSSRHPLKRQSTVPNSKWDKPIIRIQHGKWLNTANGTSGRFLINFLDKTTCCTTSRHEVASFWNTGNPCENHGGIKWNLSSAVIKCRYQQWRHISSERWLMICCMQANNHLLLSHPSLSRTSYDRIICQGSCVRLEAVYTWWPAKKQPTHSHTSCLNYNEPCKLS